MLLDLLASSHGGWRVPFVQTLFSMDSCTWPRRELKGTPLSACRPPGSLCLRCHLNYKHILPPVRSLRSGYGWAALSLQALRAQNAKASPVHLAGRDSYIICKCIWSIFSNPGNQNHQLRLRHSLHGPEALYVFINTNLNTSVLIFLHL